MHIKIGVSEILICCWRKHKAVITTLGNCLLFLLKLLNIHFNPTAVIPLPGTTQETRKLTPTKNKLIAGLHLTAKPGNTQVHPQAVAQSSMATGGSRDPPPPRWIEKARHRGCTCSGPTYRKNPAAETDGGSTANQGGGTVGQRKCSNLAPGAD